MARWFNGNAANYLNVSTNDLSLDGSVKFALFARIRIDAYAVGYIAGMGVYYQIEWNQNNDSKFRFGFDDSTGSFTEAYSYATGSHGHGEWMSVCMVMDGSATYFYINGHLAGRGGAGSGSRNVGGATNWSIGYDAIDAVRPFTGGICDVMVFNGQALTPADVRALHLGVPPTILHQGTNVLKAWYPLNGENLKDAVGAHAALTVNGKVPAIPDPRKAYKESLDLLQLATLVGNFDSGTEPLALIPSAVETPGIGSFGTLSLALTPIITYEGLNSEFGTDNFILKPSGVDQQVIDDADTVTLKFTPSGVEAPQYGVVEAAVEYLTLKPSGIDVYAREYVDSGNVLLHFTPDAHECFNHPTPLWEFVVNKRWEMALVDNRWGVDDIDTRWHAFVIDTGLDNSC